MGNIQYAIFLFFVFINHKENQRQENQKSKLDFIRNSTLISGSEDKASACNAGDPGSIPGSGRSPGEGNGNPLQYSCLENSMDREAWQAIVHGVAKSQTRLSDFTSRHFNPKYRDLNLLLHLTYKTILNNSMISRCLHYTSQGPAGKVFQTGALVQPSKFFPGDLGHTLPAAKFSACKVQNLLAQRKIKRKPATF